MLRYFVILFIIFVFIIAASAAMAQDMGGEGEEITDTSFILQTSLEPDQDSGIVVKITNSADFPFYVKEILNLRAGKKLDPEYDDDIDFQNAFKSRLKAAKTSPEITSRKGDLDTMRSDLDALKLAGTPEETSALETEIEMLETEIDKLEYEVTDVGASAETVYPIKPGGYIRFHQNADVRFEIYFEDGPLTENISSRHIVHVSVDDDQRQHSLKIKNRNYPIKIKENYLSKGWVKKDSIQTDRDNTSLAKKDVMPVLHNRSVGEEIELKTEESMEVELSF